PSHPEPSLPGERRWRGEAEETTGRTPTTSLTAGRAAKAGNGAGCGPEARSDPRSRAWPHKSLKGGHMRGSSKGSTVPNQSHPPNAFTTSFLGRLAERDEPPTAGEADVAGPWRIDAIPGHGFGLFRIGESLGRGF